MKYLAYDPENNDIYGVGDGPSDAIEDAESNLPAGRHRYELWRENQKGKPFWAEYRLLDVPEELDVVEATDELAQAVDSRGGDVPWKLEDGRAVLK